MHSLSDALRESAAAIAAAAVVEAAKAEKTEHEPPRSLPEVAPAGPPAAAALLAGMVTLTDSAPSPESHEPTIPTALELASTQRGESAAVDLTTTALLGSPAESEPKSLKPALAASVPPPLPAAGPLPEPAATPAAKPVAAVASAAEGSSVEDAHDEFFSAGEAGSYVGGPISDLPDALGEAPDQEDFDELAAHGRRVIRRTPEQEARRERNIKMVSGLVGVGLAIACVALWRSHRAGSVTELAPTAPQQISNELARPPASPLEPAVTALIPAPPVPEAAHAPVPAAPVPAAPVPVPAAPAPPVPVPAAPAPPVPVPVVPVPTVPVLAPAPAPAVVVAPPTLAVPVMIDLAAGDERSAQLSPVVPSGDPSHTSGAAPPRRHPTHRRPRPKDAASAPTAATSRPAAQGAPSPQPALPARSPASASQSAAPAPAPSAPVAHAAPASPPAGVPTAAPGGDQANGPPPADAPVADG
jgi:hypothetical protein